MAGQRKLKKAYKRLDKKKADEITVIPGILGFPINGINTVEVRNRNGYVYVRLRDNQSEVVQAFNTNVSPVYGLPVLITRDKINKSRYSVLSRDIGRYENWGTSSPYLPRHGAQHSFDPTAVGGDIVWVYNRQFMPLNVYPSGSFGSMNVLISPTTYYRNGLWHYAGETGTASFAGYKPTGSSARMVLVSLDNFDNPQLTPGSFFASTLTGTNQIFSYIPQVPATDNIPIAAIRLVSGTSVINWDNIYDVRPFFMASGFQSTGTSGHTIADEGTPLANRPTLNFIGANVWAQDNAGSNRTDIIISGTSDGTTNNYYSSSANNVLPIYGNNAFVVTGTIAVFNDNLTVSASGTIAYINANAGVGAGLNVVSVLDNSTFRVSGSVFSFDNGLYVSVTGSVAYINVSGTNNISTLNDLSDVTVPTPSEGDLLVQRSSEWVNEAPIDISSDAADITGINFTDQGADVSAPGAGHHALYAKSNGIYVIDNGSTVVGPLGTGGGGAVTGRYRQFSYSVISGDLMFLVDDEGYPIFILCDLE